MRSITILILVCLPLATASADTVILSFPELAGDYEADPYTPPNPGYPQMRSLDFTIPAHVTGIDQLELVVSGTGSMPASPRPTARSRSGGRP